MTDLIDFMDRLGGDAQLRYAGREVLAQALVEAGIEPLARKAMLAADRRRLEFLVGAKANVCCMVHAPQGDEDAKAMPKKAPSSLMDEVA